MEDIREIFEEFLKSTKSANQYEIEAFKLRQNVSDMVLVTAYIGGSSGGNCWNSNPSVPYRKDSEEIEDDIASSIKSAFGEVTEKLGISENVLELVAKNFAEDLRHNDLDTKTNGDYYGNYSEYAVYGVPVKEFFNKILSNSNVAILEEVLADFTSVEDKAYQNKVLREQEADLEKKLKEFDEVHTKEKQQLANQVQNLTRRLENYDTVTAKQKKLLETSLTEVKNALNGEPTIKPKMR